MPYSQAFTSITMNGTLADSQEIWSAGFHADTTGIPMDYDTWLAYYTDIGEDLAERIAEFVNDEATRVPTGVTLADVKFARIGTDGKYVDAPLVVEQSATGLYNESYVPQNAMALTMFSDKYRDPGKYNRFYLPVTLGGGGGTYCLSPGAQAALLVQFSAFITDINDILATGPGPSPEVVSVVSATGTGFSNPVKGVRVGKIVDTQQRRRNKLPESYITQDIA